MRHVDVEKTMTAINDWVKGDGSLIAVNSLLGDTSKALSRMLLDNLLCTPDFKPQPGVSPYHIVNCILLYLAMRHSLHS